MDSDEAQKEAFRLELNAAIMQYRDAYCEMVGDPNNLALIENYRRVQTFVHEVARKQKERFNNLRNNTGGQTVEAAGSCETTGQTAAQAASNISQSATTANCAKGTTGQYAFYPMESVAVDHATMVTNVKNEILPPLITKEEVTTDGAPSKDMEKIQGDKMALGPCALYSKKTVEIEKVATDASGQTEVPAPLNIKVEVQTEELPHLAIETNPAGHHAVYNTKSVLAEKLSMDTNGKTEEQSPLIESEDIKTEVPSVPEIEKAQGDRMALGSYTAQSMKSVLVKTSAVRGDKKTEYQTTSRRAVKPPGHGVNPLSATGAQRKRAGASVGRRNTYKKRRPLPEKEVHSEPADPGCACTNCKEVIINDVVHFVMLDDDNVVVLNDDPQIDSSGSSTSTVTSDDNKTIMGSQEKFLRVVDLIPFKDQHKHKQKEQKRASRLRKSTANHSQFVYSEDWEDSKKRKKRESSTSTQTQVQVPSGKCSGSQSESEITQARAFRILNEGGIETFEEIRMSPDLFASQEDGPKPSKATSSGTTSSAPQRLSRTTHGRKQVLVNCSLMDGEPELLLEYPPSPIKSTPEFTSSDREREATTTSSSSTSPDSQPPLKNFGLSPMEYEALLASMKAPYIPIINKPKPSILQRSKNQLHLTGEKIKSDPFRPLIIEVPNPGGEPKLYIPAIIRSPGLGKQGSLENGERIASQWDPDGQPNWDFMPSPRSLLIPKRVPTQDDVCCVCHKPGAVASNSLLLTSEVLTPCAKCLSFYHLSCSNSTSTAATLKLCPRCAAAAAAHNKFTGPPPKKDEDLKKVLATKQLQLIKEKAALEKRVFELTEVNVVTKP